MNGVHVQPTSKGERKGKNIKMNKKKAESGRARDEFVQKERKTKSKKGEQGKKMKSRGGNKKLKKRKN